MDTVKDGWKLSIRIEYVPIEPDKKEHCHTCRGTGKDNFLGEDDCTTCYGNGFTYKVNPRGPQPEVDRRLTQWLRDAYQEYREIYGAN